VAPTSRLPCACFPPKAAEKLADALRSNLETGQGKVQLGGEVRGIARFPGDAAKQPCQPTQLLAAGTHTPSRVHAKPSPWHLWPLFFNAAVQLVWREYARGKDVARFLRDKPELMEQLVRSIGPGAQGRRSELVPAPCPPRLPPLAPHGACRSSAAALVPAAPPLPAFVPSCPAVALPSPLSPHRLPAAPPDRTVDDLIHDSVVQLVQRRLLVACDRTFKRPKPGRTKLVKWPRSLDAMQVADRPSVLAHLWWAVGMGADAGSHKRQG
jgi:hypothetical protein